MAAQLAEIGIGDLSAESGVNIETIRYYERIGLVPRPRRTASGYRRYTMDDLSRLRFIRRTRDLGFGLPEVKALLALAGREPRACGRAKAVAEVHLQAVRTRLADLRRMERVLSRLIRDCADGERPHCPLIEALSTKA